MTSINLETVPFKQHYKLATYANLLFYFNIMNENYLNFWDHIQFYFIGIGSWLNYYLLGR